MKQDQSMWKKEHSQLLDEYEKWAKIKQQQQQKIGLQGSTPDK